MGYFLKFKTILELKRYSQSTIDTYMHFLQMFAKQLTINTDKLELLQDSDVLNTIVKMVRNKKYSNSSQKQLIGAVNLFYKELFKRTIDFSIIYPKQREQYLPTVLSKTEVKLLFKCTNNLKHKTILASIYGLGLRISEATNLKLVDIDSQRMLVHIRNAKGRKDRMVMLSPNLLKVLRAYFKAYKPQNYLFEGQKGGQYAAGTIRKVFRKSLALANIKKSATVHTLRHSFATHLLENGTDIRVIQKLLGHNNINTTLQYTRVSQTTIQNVQSALDTL